MTKLVNYQVDMYDVLTMITVREIISSKYWRQLAYGVLRTVWDHNSGLPASRVGATGGPRRSRPKAPLLARID